MSKPDTTTNFRPIFAPTGRKIFLWIYGIKIVLMTTILVAMVIYHVWL